ncbi:PREDICTED: uncharacterized protein LOC109176288 isoform X1 [Ipomoea nil]|uniref:uncharacterized protein LOC109176288 isoform X1 n=2 Tax=Ipomoea nil TaxID=35883 RepID=UPI000901F04A|nr:PREDICTED: uncharacterized protein LOC109176288 isoform X1 [Ipomoea nil]XP_019181299.1 PREDICTED: uncharacterized protein LOC109176288 isoform X1 [Ipomoea nil]XP_019181300.1 PREDICTED: uncharacterized protein LOC109176288 isoform X1 [Ipomoea nil]
MDFHLPFKVGQSTEAKSFLSGYRCAWFRCKIKEIKKKGGYWHAMLEYFDFPDEKLTWMKLSQKQLHRVGKSKGTQRQLMLRPCYPPICNESEISNVNLVPEVRVIVRGIWQVGDLVDWWTSDCFWSGKLTEILDNDKAMIELTPPPIGEGGSYEVCIKDLRPTLDWSQELGWTLPTSLDGENGHSCARIIQPVSGDLGATLDEHTMHGSEREVRSTSVSNTPVVFEDSGNRESSVSVSVCDSGMDAATEVAGLAAEDLYYIECPLNRLRTSGGTLLNSSRSDTLEAAIMDLEEMRNKVRWIRRILESGNPLPNSQSSWKFVEHRASSTPK